MRLRPCCYPQVVPVQLAHVQRLLVLLLPPLWLQCHQHLLLLPLPLPVLEACHLLLPVHLQHPVLALVLGLASRLVSTLRLQARVLTALSGGGAVVMVRCCLVPLEQYYLAAAQKLACLQHHQLLRVQHLVLVAAQVAYCQQQELPQAYLQAFV